MSIETKTKRLYDLFASVQGDVDAIRDEDLAAIDCMRDDFQRFTAGPADLIALQNPIGTEKAITNYMQYLDVHNRLNEMEREHPSTGAGAS